MDSTSALTHGPDRPDPFVASQGAPNTGTLGTTVGGM